MIILKKIAIAFLIFLAGCKGFIGSSSISEINKIRYLQKIETKNDRYVKQQEKKTRKLLANLSEKEKNLFNAIDSVKQDSTVIKNSFSKIQERFENEDINADQVLSKLNQPVSLETYISTKSISENLSGDLKNYLKQQLLTSSFLADTSCTNCEKLKQQTTKAKENIAKTSQKLERLKSIESDIKKHQETLKNYGVNTPEVSGKLKAINKDCYYYTQGMNGFKDLYTNPAKGIENSLLKKLSFSKDFKLFQTKFNSLPISSSTLSGLTGGVPDMSGYQTKAQVQAMLPQNAQGITPELKSQLVSNMQNGLKKFTELRDEKPDLSMFKDKPNFKINPYKGLPFRKRMVPGFVFQPQAKTQSSPIIIDLGGTLGFKLIDRLTPMVGISTKVGLGKDIHHLTFTYQGLIAKAGFDTKLVYGFSLQGWYEATWKPLPDKYTEDNRINYPTPSLIAGICNTYQISKSVKGTFLIGYDFFYNKYQPNKSPWVIRMGLQ